MDQILTRAEILDQVAWLRSCVNRGDYDGAAKVAAQISRACKKSKPDYDYTLTEWDFLCITENLYKVNYGVGGYMPPVKW